MDVLSVLFFFFFSHFFQQDKVKIASFIKKIMVEIAAFLDFFLQNASKKAMKKYPIYIIMYNFKKSQSPSPAYR